MGSTIVAGVCIVVSCLSVGSPARAAPTAISISIPLSFGGHAEHEPAPVASESDVRSERRLRITRYAFQVVDALISAIGYRAYRKCLSCLAFPGGGPVGSGPVSVADYSGNRPAEANPLVAPFSNGGILTLALGTLAFDFADARIERRWSTQRRTAADIAEIGGHLWGIASWLPEIETIHKNIAIASACGAQWRSKNYGEAFSDGCVNEYYRAGPQPASPKVGASVMVVCAPAKFTSGTYLFAAPGNAVVASGKPCTNLTSPFP
jgi:hypothetical protein